MAPVLPLEDFLRPLHIDTTKIHSLASSLARTYTHLAAESQDQFLPTPISEEILTFEGGLEGKYLAIDIGGTNLRVAFIEPLGPSPNDLQGESRVERHLEKAWPILEKLKRHNADDLFAWIGRCVVEVVGEGYASWSGELIDPLPMGVTFSFPMEQKTLSDATLMAMGKGFALTANLDLAKLLMKGYESAWTPNLPKIKIVAICNDAVATLVSFAYQMKSNHRQKAAMSLIVGTGTNATIPLAISKLHSRKRPKEIKVSRTRKDTQDLNIAVNTEWSINGAAVPLRDHHFITVWDEILDADSEGPGFQPFELMTAGRYLGELGRLICVDYFVNNLKIKVHALPLRLRTPHGLTTTFLGHLRPHFTVHDFIVSLQVLNTELPPPILTDIPWAIPINEKATYEAVFKKLDVHELGDISNEAALYCLRQSKIDNLAHVWKLIECEKRDRICEEDFVLAMYLVSERRKGMELPDELPLELVPPHRRRKWQWQWTQDTASILYLIGKSVQTRAAGLTASAIIALLSTASLLPPFFTTPPSPSLSSPPSSPPKSSLPTISLPNGSRLSLSKPPSQAKELLVGYTGGCIEHFQDYRADCERFLGQILRREWGEVGVPKVSLRACHDGGVVGAGVLVGAVLGLEGMGKGGKEGV